MVKLASSMALVLLVLGLLPASAVAAEGTLSVRLSNEDRLLVFIDGEEKGETPLEISLKSGRYSIEVKAAAYSMKMVSGDAVVRAGQITALVGDWEAGTFTEDVAATTGRLSGVIRLHSGVQASLTESDLSKLASSASVTLKCGTEDHPISASPSSAEAGTITVQAKTIPIGDCEITAQALGQTHQASFAATAGAETSVEVGFPLQWSRVILKRLEGSDTAKLSRPGTADASLRPGVASPLAPPGDFEVTVVHSGKSTRVAQASAHAGLFEVEAYGELSLAAGEAVEGMTLEIDGDAVALAPSYILTVGEHTIRSSAPGRHPQSVTVSISAGASQPWSATLAEVRPGEVLATVTGPETWQLAASGRESADGKSLSLAPGAHRVTVSAAGWGTAEQEVEVTEGQSQTLNFTLEVLPIAVAWSALPSGAKLTLSDAAGKQTSPAVEAGRAEASLLPGAYSWEVTAPKTTPQSGLLELKIGAPAQEVSVALASYPVVVFSDLVSGAEVTLRGEQETKELKSEGTDLQVTLPPGKYEWQASADQRESASGTIELVADGAVTQVSVPLPLLGSVVTKRKRSVIIAALAGGAGGFAGVGVYFVADAQDLYGFALDQHAEYESSTVSEDARWFRDQAYDAREVGQQKERLGAGLIAAGSALAIGAVIHALRTKNGKAVKAQGKAKTIGVSMLPSERGLSFGIGGEW